MDFETIEGMLALAHSRLPKVFIEFVLTGAGSELTIKRNRQALDRFALDQTMLADYDEVDTSTEFLGCRLPSPLLTSPMFLGYIHPEGDLEMVRGAGRDGMLSTVANENCFPMDEIAAAASGPLLCQILAGADPGKIKDKLEKVNVLPQFKGVCVTVDGAMGKRLDHYIDGGVYQKHFRMPPPLLPDRRFSWADIDQVRDATTKPFGLKGILSVEDSRKALDHGADFIWVSNHGGRKADSVRASIDVLDEIVEFVDARVPLIVDSGFQRGSDVLVGLAKGATLVAFGKFSAIALAVGGSDGIANLYRILKEEFRIALGFSGLKSIGEITPDIVHRVDY